MMKKVWLTLLLVLFLFLVSCTDLENPSPVQETSEPVCEHVWTENYEITTNPTETETGIREKYCTLCGASDPQTIPLLSQEDYLVTYYHPACEESGVRTYISEEWGEYEVTVPPTGHTYADEPDRCTATCTEDGYSYYACTTCGEEKEVACEALLHDYSFSRSEGVCTKIYVCSRCLQEKQTVSHNLDEGTHFDGDCAVKEYGYTLYTCQTPGCGYEETITDFALTHIYNKDTGKCENCSYVCPHSFSDYVCTVCSFSIENELRTNHIYYYNDSVFCGHYPNSHVSDPDTIKKLNENFSETLDRVKLSDGYYYSRSTTEKQRNRYDMTFSDGTSLSSVLSKQTVHYFRWDPIEWKLQREEDGKWILTSDTVLLMLNYQSEDKTVYADPYFYAIGDDLLATDQYANSWEYSNVRLLLNGDFLSDAFTADEQELLLAYTVDQTDTGYYSDDYQTNQNAPSDKIFIPAFSDYFQEEDDVEEYNEERSKRVSDYLLCQNYLYDDGKYSYFLRSTGSSSVKICTITVDGTLSYDELIWTFCGIAPSICVSSPKKE